MRWFRKGGASSLADDVPGAFRHALGSALSGDMEGVEAALTEVVQSDSSDVDAYLGLLQVYQGRSELGRAISLAQTLILRRDLRSEQALRARLSLAACFREGGFVARSIEVFEEVLVDDRRNPSALRALSELMTESGEFARALTFLRRWAQVEGISSTREEATLWLALADQSASAGKPDAARRSLRKALRRDPQFGQAHLRLAQSEWERGRAKSAARSYLRSVALDPALSRDAYAGLEECGPQMRRKGSYEALLRGRIHEEWEDWSARVLLSRVLLEEERFGEAIRELKTVLDAEPDHAAALVVHLRATLALASESSPSEEALAAVLGFLEETDRRLSGESERLGDSS
ncbi:MAG: tetratricopeptide repeat protein [Proteobacteria bacterium TMED72]|nr:MAG: tetratricopeptide repeat protein [Proteobacteria bacterium TMED72]